MRKSYCFVALVFHYNTDGDLLKVKFRIGLHFWSVTYIQKVRLSCTDYSIQLNCDVMWKQCTQTNLCTREKNCIYTCFCILESSHISNRQDSWPVLYPLALGHHLMMMTVTSIILMDVCVISFKVLTIALMIILVVSCV